MVKIFQVRKYLRQKVAFQKDCSHRSKMVLDIMIFFNSQSRMCLCVTSAIKIKLHEYNSLPRI